MDTSNVDSDQFYGQNKNLNQVWTKENFKCLERIDSKKSYLRSNLSLDLSTLKTTWAIRNIDDDKCTNEDLDESQSKIDTEVMSPTLSIPEKEVIIPPHHARRPMNAFLMFCKKHRPIARQKYTHLENRGVTRILAHWWSLLDDDERNCYTALAKEHKDAFWSANPDFQWYKLPAPPLRTLNNRKRSRQKPASPLASPAQLTPSSAIFTPGKLADETQLGNLTSLMNSSNNFCEISKTCIDNNEFELNEHHSSSNNNNNNNFENNNEKYELSPTYIGTDVSIPLKPIKKRAIDNYSNRDIPQNMFNTSQDKSEEDFGISGYKPDNLTQQELMNKVVESMFPEQVSGLQTGANNTPKSNKEKSKVTRKSLRTCKGKRYTEFMTEGKLYGSKPIKHFGQVEIDYKFDTALNTKIEDAMHNKIEIQTPTLNLSDTIRRLAAHTNIKLEDIYGSDDVIPEGQIPSKNSKLKRTESKKSEDNAANIHAGFNLDLRINSLPIFSYETYMQRKRDSKKRKYSRSKSESSASKTKVLILSETDTLVGSKKRKNKHTITRLEKPDSDGNYNPPSFNNDLSGLATLAEVAANTEKIN